MTVYDDETFFKSYAGMARSLGGLGSAGEWEQFRRLLPEDMAGLDVLDLGCGYGWHCAYCASRGARSVLGIDPSERMLSRARELNAAPRIEYRRCAVEDFDWPEDAFDLCISNLALHYVEDLRGVYEGVYRALRPGGRFALNIEHPAFTAGVNEDWYRGDDGRILHWPIDRYFEPGPRRTLFCGCEVTKYHHTLAQIIGGLLEAGFALTALDEARPSPRMIADDPAMADELRRPIMLLAAAVRG